MKAEQRPLVLAIVEDQEIMRRLLREFVQSAYPDCAILEAADGGQALALCTRHRPALVLMDVHLPDCNGIDLTPRIKALLPDTQVIVVSHYSGRVFVERALAAGACTYISKDRVSQELLPAIAEALQPWQSPVERIQIEQEAGDVRNQ